MAEPDKLSAAQYAFAAHLRDPDAHPAPAGIEDRRLKIYRDLFIGNIKSLLAGTFPVTRSLFSDSAWETLARGFYSKHSSRTPLFLEVPQEFIQYLQNEHVPTQDDPPFLLELAHYEWVELAVSVAADTVNTGIDPSGDLLEGAPVKSPHAFNLCYQYPVHRISSDFQPSKPGSEPTRLVVYRDKSDEVGFMEVNPVTARLLELIEADDHRSGRQLLEQIAMELKHPKPQTVIDGGGATLEALRTAGIVIGITT